MRFSRSETSVSAPDVPASIIADTSAFFSSSLASDIAFSSTAFSATACSSAIAFALASACCIAIVAAVSLATFFANSSRLKSLFSDIIFSLKTDVMSVLS